jgi:hypothetical protein
MPSSALISFRFVVGPGLRRDDGVRVLMPARFSNVIPLSDAGMLFALAPLLSWGGLCAAARAHSPVSQSMFRKLGTETAKPTRAAEERGPLPPASD